MMTNADEQQAPTMIPPHKPGENPHTIRLGSLTISLWRSAGTDDCHVVQIDTDDDDVLDLIRVNINDAHVYGPEFTWDDRTFTCGTCGTVGTVGTVDDRCEDGEPCPDEECAGRGGVCHVDCIADGERGDLIDCHCAECVALTAMLNAELGGDR